MRGSGIDQCAGETEGNYRQKPPAEQEEPGRPVKGTPTFPGWVSDLPKENFTREGILQVKEAVWATMDRRQMGSIREHFQGSRSL